MVTIMKSFMLPIGIAVAMLFGTQPVYASGKSGGPKSKSAGTQVHASKPKVVSPKANNGAAARPKASGAMGASKAGQNGSSKHAARAAAPKVKSTASSTTKTRGHEKKSATTVTSSTQATKTNSTTTTTTTTSGTGTAPLSKVQQKLQRNTNLASKLESRLPAGTNLKQAADGFKNLGQFVAAVNVSNNHKLEFATLKTDMVDNGMSLGQAMQKQRKTIDGPVEAARAERDADTLIRITETTSTTSTTTTSNSTTSTTTARSSTTKPSRSR